MKHSPPSPSITRVPLYSKSPNMMEFADQKINSWGTNIATGLRPEQEVDSKNPMMAVSAAKPLTEAQWVGISYSVQASRLAVLCSIY
jgi:hypothetical protein